MRTQRGRTSGARSNETCSSYRRIRIHRQSLHPTFVETRIRSSCIVQPRSDARLGRRSSGIRPTCARPDRRGRVIESVKPTHLLHLAWFVVPGKLISSPENFGWVTSSFELIRDFARARRQESGRLGFGLRVRLELRILLRKIDSDRAQYRLRLLQTCLARAASLVWRVYPD